MPSQRTGPRTIIEDLVRVHRSQDAKDEGDVALAARRGDSAFSSRRAEPSFETECGERGCVREITD